MTDITVQETAKLQNGICPDCGSNKILGGPQGPGSQNVLCDACKMQFNMPTTRGDYGQRIGVLKPDNPGIPMKIPGEGSIIQGIGRTNVGCIALHNCSLGTPTGHCGCVDLVTIGLEGEEIVKFLSCGCGMRISIEPSVKTWEDLTAIYQKAGTIIRH